MYLFERQNLQKVKGKERERGLAFTGLQSSDYISQLYILGDRNGGSNNGIPATQINVLAFGFSLSQPSFCGYLEMKEQLGGLFVSEVIMY